MYLEEAVDERPLAVPAVYTGLLVALAVPVLVLGIYWAPLVRWAAAAEMLSQLSRASRTRCGQMIEEITELAELPPANTGMTLVADAAPQLLTLQLGRVCVRYSISEDTRTLSIEHVIVIDEDDDLL